MVDVFLQLIRAELELGILTASLGRLNSLVPLLVAAPSYLAGLVTLGLIVQTRVAYDQVSGALSWFVSAYREIARWRANIERLAAFADAMDATAEDLARAGVRIASADPGAIRLVDVRLEAPRGRVILDGASAAVAAGDRVALLGAPGRGKTTLFRGLAGLWPFGAGRIEGPGRERMLFVPQRPYLRQGTRRAAVCWPAAENGFEDARVREALGQVGLAQLEERLDAAEPREEQLSVHEQQLLAIARALLHRPEWLLLERLPRVGVIAAGLRPSALARMGRSWTLTERDGRAILQAA